MKRLVLLVLILASSSYAQIPNPGFEQWSGGVPTNWVSLTLPGTIVQSTNAHGGSFAVRGNVVESSGFGFPPVLVAGPTGEGFPVSQRHAVLTGFFQFTPVSGDVFFVSVVMIQGGQAIGVGGFVGFSSQTSYTQFSAPIVYTAGGNPDTCYIQIQIADTATGLVNAGSFFLLDDLAFSGVNAVQSGVMMPAAFALGQNYPNPFNPVTRIEYYLPERSWVSLKVFDMLGREVATLVEDAEDPGIKSVLFDGGSGTSGVYFYRLSAGAFTSTKRMLLVK